MNIISKSDTEMVLNVGPIDTAIANAIRRAMIANVTTMAMETVRFTENNGLLPDEMIAHRLGLIPVKRLSDLVSKATFTLDVRNDSNDLLTIYSDSLKTTSEDVIIPDPNIILTKLDHGHAIKLEVDAVLGTGSTHAKWGPTTGLSYELNDDLSYTYNIETIGTMLPEEIFVKAIDYLVEKLDFYIIDEVV